MKANQLIVLVSTVVGCVLANAPILANAMETPIDPFLWLEEVEGERALKWVHEQNSKSLAELERSPVYAQIKKDISNIVLAKDRVPHATFEGGYFWNFWQDEKNPRGLLRRTTLEEYKKPDPTWDVILNLDELSKKENENWVFDSRISLDKHSDRAIISLSRGGKDATVVREFDYRTKQFIADGFYLPEAKSRITPVNENVIIFGSDFGKGSLTESGYPRILKVWKRGNSQARAKIIYKAKPSDLSVGAYLVRDGNLRHLVIVRAVDFYNHEYFLQPDQKTWKREALQQIPLPTSADLLSIKNGQVYAQLKEPLTLSSRTIPGNSLLRFPLHDKNLENSEVIFTAEPGQSINDVAVRADQVLVTILNNVRSQVLSLKQLGTGDWSKTVLPLPTNGVIEYRPKNPDENVAITTMTYMDYVTPYGQYLVHDDDGSYDLELLKRSPARFDSSGMEVSQNFAVSRDGTRIPYFLIASKNLKKDGTNPTLLYGYGGFEVSMTPSYLSIAGKAWLERGGVYVVANIRGGGEFGPEWHRAAIKQNRQKSFDDFIAVAEDLIAQKITTPRHLGMQGGSNGGLLVGATLIQRPDLFDAALIEVPLLDMLRYTKLLAGASWIGEYGDPENSADCQALLKYSPYQNLKPDRKYPRPFFVTSTKDDRVHPGHARKMAALMDSQGHPFLYYEATDGGHSGGTNPRDMVNSNSLQFTYLWARLR